MDEAEEAEEAVVAEEEEEAEDAVAAERRRRRRRGKRWCICWQRQGGALSGRQPRKGPPLTRRWPRCKLLARVGIGQPRKRALLFLPHRRRQGLNLGPSPRSCGVW